MAATALIMGAPTLRGGFVGGDDHRLVLDHVLVNHPSFEHAVKLFTIPHRDLYQPLPLLSFSAEFAVAVPLGLFDRGAQNGAWLFHLTNVVLHAINALLVFAVIVRLSIGTRTHRSACDIATVAGVLFAAHPLNTEVVAWINGRMMLLSTLFALASLLTVYRWWKRGGSRWALLAVACVVCCGLSKIRISLPVLLFLIPLSQHRRINRRFMFLWTACLLITAGLAVVNYIASSHAGMFSGAEENLHGPPLVRAILGLAWYLSHLVWPAGLASWYPTPTLVRWSDAATLRALAIVIPVLAGAVWAARRRRIALYGFGWFFVAIAATLQLVPNRNVLAADRYMYLPIIGLLLVIATAAHWIYSSAVRRWSIGWVRLASAPVGLAVVVSMILTSWHVGSFYETPVKKGERIAQLAPTTPHVWERLAWAYHRAGRYNDAIAAARKELVHGDAPLRSEAHQVIGAAQLALEQFDDAIATLRLARKEDPESPSAAYHLARAYEKMERLDEALPLYEETARRAPLANPKLLRLAALYRRLGRPADARKTFDRILANNPYDVKATMALAELDIEVGTTESFEAARHHLESLLDWMPENADAWTNLGVVYNGLGRDGDAIAAYRRALQERPTHVTAALNLASIYDRMADAQRARPLFLRAARDGLQTVEQVTAVHDFLIAQGRPARAAALWQEYLTRFPESQEARAFSAWALALAGQTAQAAARMKEVEADTPEQPLVTATAALVALMDGDFGRAVSSADALSTTGADGADARSRLLRALEAYDQKHPGRPGTYCLTARLLIANGQTEAAGAFTDLCEKHCQDPSCEQCIRRLRVQRRQ